MRTLTSSMSLARDNISYYPIVKVDIYKSLMFSNTPTTNTRTSGSPTITDGSIDFTVDSGVTRIVKSSSGALTFQKGMSSSDSFTPTVGGSSVAVRDSHRPSMYSNYVFWVTSAGVLQRGEINSTLFNAKDPLCITTTTTIATGLSSYCSTHAIDGNTVAIVYPEAGGLNAKLYIYTSSWTLKTSTSPFVSPGPPIASTNGSVANQSAAAKLGNSIFVYASIYYTGEIWGVEYNTSLDAWSDTFVAVPSDQCRTVCTNAYVYNNKIVLNTLFQREDDFYSPNIYNLAMLSRTGRTFSMDRFSVYSSLGWRFTLKAYGTAVYATYLNEQIVFDATYRYSDVSTTKTSISDFLSVSTDDSLGGSGCEITLANSDVQYSNHANIQRGSLVELYAGYKTSSGDEYILYGKYIISSITERYADGFSGITISCEQESFRKTGMMSYPFYVEIPGKTAGYSRCDSLSDMATINTVYPGMSSLPVTMWGGDGYTNVTDSIVGVNPVKDGASTYFTMSGSHKSGVQTKDIKTLLSLKDYPTPSANVVLNIYAWSATAAISQQNDTISPRLLVENSSGVERYITTYTTVGSVRPPQTYVDTVTGGYPMTFSFALGVDINSTDKIKKVILVLEASNTTTAYIERIDISGVSNEYQAAGSNMAWNLVENIGAQTLADNTFSSSALEVPKPGRPFIMFSNLPYAPFNFEAYGTFEYGMAIDSMAWVESTGLSSYGIVFLAEDGDNYIVARYEWQTKKIALVKVRNTVETTLAFASYDVSLYSMWIDICVKHINGKFSIYYKPSNQTAWNSPLTYQWQESDGAITSYQSTPKLGIYGYKNPTSFLINAFDPKESKAIMPYPGQDLSSLWASIASSDIVDIDGIKYRYKSKTAYIPTRGPFQPKNITNWKSGNGAYSPGMAVEITWLNWNGDGAAYIDYYVSSGPNVWKVRGTNWKPSGLPNRSRWFSSDIGSDDYVIGGDKSYVGPGLEYDYVESDEDSTHSEGTYACIGSYDYIRCRSFYAVSGESNTTISDLIDQICEMADSNILFVGDYTSPSQTIGSSMFLLSKELTSRVPCYTNGA